MRAIQFLFLVPIVHLFIKILYLSSWVFQDESVTISYHHEETTIIVPLPSSKWSRKGNYYHTMQCVWSGLLAARVDPIDAAQTPEKYRFCSPPRRDPETSLLIQQIEHAFFPVARGLSYEECVKRHNPTWDQGFVNNTFDDDKACRFHESVPRLHLQKWFHDYMQAKNMTLTLRSCDNTTRFQGLLVNRLVSRHIENETINSITRSTLQSNNSNRILGWKSLPDLADATILEQLSLFQSYPLIVLPHGAAETNAVASNSIHSNSLPTAIIEICPPYSHCPCIGMCPRFYRVRWNDLTVGGIAFEHPATDCDQFCSLPYDRTATKNANIPAVDLETEMKDIIGNVSQWWDSMGNGCANSKRLELSLKIIQSELVTVQYKQAKKKHRIFSFFWRPARH